MKKLLNDFKGKLEKELELNLNEGIKFDGKYQTTNNGALDLSELRENIKKHFGVKSIKEVHGIYKLYIENELFYIGISKSSIFSRIKRHYSKHKKYGTGNAPKRYSFFGELVNSDKNVTIEIIRIEGEKLDYLLLIEELLTLSEKPKYKDDINNEIKINENKSLEL